MRNSVFNVLLKLDFEIGSKIYLWNVFDVE